MFGSPFRLLPRRRPRACRPVPARIPDQLAARAARRIPWAATGRRTGLVFCLVAGLMGGLAGAAAAGPRLAPQPSPVIQCGNPPEYPSQGQLHVKLHINQLKGAWGWSRVGEANKDENGYPVRLPGGQPSESRILMASPGLSGVAPYAGRFRLMGQGQGSFRLLSGAQKTGYTTAALPRVTVRGEDYWYVDFTYDPARGGGKISLQITDLPAPGDHLRAMALVHDSHLAAWTRGEIFMPEVIADLSLFGRQQMAATGRRGALRYMQMLQVNGVYLPGPGHSPLTQTIPQRERRFVGTDYYSFTRIQNNGGPVEADKLIPTALPVEDVAALANATGTDVWYNLAPDITDARARQIAVYLRDHLDPGLTVYWEYGNEIWNSAKGFAGFPYAQAMGQAKFPGLSKTAAVYEWDVYRSMQLFSGIREVFAATPARSRYVAAFWAFDSSNQPDGTLIPDSFAGRYFAASQARREPDIGALPEDIITDMAVGGYFSNPPPEVAAWLEAQLPGDPRAQAAAFTAMVEMGMDGDMVRVGPGQIDRPLTGVAPGTPLAVHALLRADLQPQGQKPGGKPEGPEGGKPARKQDGKPGGKEGQKPQKPPRDPLAEMDRVLRIEGRELQYRGVQSASWTPVVIFDRAPGQDLDAMVRAGELTPLGGMFRGEVRDGFTTQLVNALDMRMARHVAFARAKGIDFHFYEGGPGADGAPGSDAQSGAGFMRAYHMGGGAARVMLDFLARIGGDVTQMCWYKTHNRQFGPTGDFWGLKEYYGQDPARAPKWQAVAGTIAAGRP